MSHFIVDTNVPTVANGRSEQASKTCVFTCGKNLKEIMDNHLIVLDDQWLIINEYRSNLSDKGQPGPGDSFFKWVLTNHGNPTRCEKVKITRTAENSFIEFPENESLLRFDPSDRKFVAVALTHPEKPPILNAVDRDWKEFETAFQEIGITIIFLCPEFTNLPRK